MIQGLHLNRIGGQLRMLIKESLNICCDLRVSSAAAESAVFVCCAALKSAGNNSEVCKCAKYWLVSDHSLFLMVINDALCHVNPGSC